MTTPTPGRVLDVPLDPGDAATEGETIGGYLKRVGRLSGDNNTWKWPLYVALAEAGLLPGVTSDPGNADGDVLPSFPEAAQAAADELITSAIKAIEQPLTGVKDPAEWHVEGEIWCPDCGRYSDFDGSKPELDELISEHACEDGGAGELAP